MPEWIEYLIGSYNLMDIDTSIQNFTKREKKKFFKEQAKGERRAAKKRTKIIWWLSCIISVILLFVGGVYSVQALSKPLPGKDVPTLGRTHVPVGTLVRYNSNPPTSGDHYATPEPAGVYDKAIPDGYLVHSLEHGYVIISYNCSYGNSETACNSFVNKLKQKVENDEFKLILIPRVVLDANFALTAWGRIDKFNIKDATIDRVNVFIQAFRGAGPENTPN